MRTQIFFPLSHAGGKTKNIFLYWLLLLKKSVPYSSPCFLTENTIFLVFVKVLLWLFTIQGTIFIVVQNQWDKFMLKINSCSISLALCYWIFLGNVLFLFIIVWPIMKWLHCTPYIIQCPYQLLREMYTNLSFLVSVGGLCIYYLCFRGYFGPSAGPSNPSHHRSKRYVPFRLS